MKGALTLSDLTVDKVEVTCECGLSKRYDRRALMAKVGDHDLPSLLRALAGAEGCERAYTVDIHSICQMAYADGVIPVREPRQP